MDGPDLMLELERSYDEARSSCPRIDVPRDLFVEYLRARMRPEGDDPRALHLGDLYLACACVHSLPGALELFERRYLTGVSAALRSIDPAPVFADEVRQMLREKLFLGGKLAGYSGRGSLESWVSVAGHRAGLSLKRRQRPPTAELSDEALSKLVPEDPELGYLRTRYRQEFQAALAEAVAALSERQQVLLRLTLIKNISHVRIAAIYGVNQSTITRWVSAARQHLTEELRRQLRDRLGAASAEVESLIRVMKGDIQFQIPPALEDSPPE